MSPVGSRGQRELETCSNSTLMPTPPGSRSRGAGGLLSRPSFSLGRRHADEFFWSWRHSSAGGFPFLALHTHSRPHSFSASSSSKSYLYPQARPCAWALTPTQAAGEQTQSKTPAKWGSSSDPASQGRGGEAFPWGSG